MAALDDIDWAAPIGHIWADCKVTWMQIDPVQANSPSGAADSTPLFEAWSRSHQE